MLSEDALMPPEPTGRREMEDDAPCPHIRASQHYCDCSECTVGVCTPCRVAEVNAAYLAGAVGMVEKLKPYLQHKPDCAWVVCTAPDDPKCCYCTCGFDELDTALAPTPPRKET